MLNTFLMMSLIIRSLCWQFRLLHLAYFFSPLLSLSLFLPLTLSLEQCSCRFLVSVCPYTIHCLAVFSEMLPYLCYCSGVRFVVTMLSNVLFGLHMNSDVLVVFFFLRQWFLFCLIFLCQWFSLAHTHTNTFSLFAPHSRLPNQLCAH